MASERVQYYPYDYHRFNEFYVLGELTSEEGIREGVSMAMERD